MSGTTIETWVVPLLVGILAGWLTRPAWLVVSGIVLQIADLLPIRRDLVASVRGAWRNQSEEPDAAGAQVTSYERLRLYQVGRLVWGRGVREDGKTFTFHYRGKLVRNTLIGTYRAAGRNSPIGRGAFELIIHNNEQLMQGYCMWHHYDTDRIESSPFEMQRSVSSNK